MPLRTPNPRYQRKPKPASRFRLPGSPPGSPRRHNRRATRPCTCPPPCAFVLGTDPFGYQCTPACPACRPIKPTQPTVRPPVEATAAEHYRHAADDLDAILADLTEAAGLLATACHAANSIPLRPVPDLEEN